VVEIVEVVHPSLGDVMGEVIDLDQTSPQGRTRSSGLRDEINVIDGRVAVTVDEINQTAADPLDRRYVEFHRTDRALDFLGSEFDRPA